MMKNSITILATALLILLLTILISTLMGALSGWVVGWFFGETILIFFSKLGITGFSMWQIGASLGFISGFLRQTKMKTTS